MRPRSLGGADDEANLWPECYEVVKSSKSQQADGAHKKDRLETELHKRVCDGGTAPRSVWRRWGSAGGWRRGYQTCG
jgi:hypothetical protein